MEKLNCYSKLQSGGITKSAAENICNMEAYRINENVSAKDILCAIKCGNRICSEKLD